MDLEYTFFGGEKGGHVGIYEMLATHILQLDYRAFRFLLAHLRKQLPRGGFSSLLQIIILRLIDTKAPRNQDNNDDYDVATLIKCYLPWAANTSSPEDNARLAYATEHLTRLLPSDYTADGVSYDGKIMEPEAVKEMLLSAITESKEKKLEKCKEQNVRYRGTAEQKAAAKEFNEMARKDIVLSAKMASLVILTFFENAEKARAKENGEDSVMTGAEEDDGPCVLSDDGFHNDDD